MTALKRVATLGLSSHQTLAEQQKIILLNEICMIILPIQFLLFLGDLWEGDRVGVWVDLGILGLTSLILLFQYWERVFLARWYFLILFSVAIAGLIMLYGHGLGGEFVYLVLLVLGLIFCERGWQQYAILVMILGFLLVSQWFLARQEPPLASTLSPIVYPSVFLASLLTLYLSFRMFLRETRRFEAQSQSLLDSLQKKNEELEKQQEEIEEKNHELQEANKELERFAYVASHDLKTPLRNIHSFLNLIEKRLGEHEDKELVEYLQYAQTSSRRMYFLIQDILNYSRLEEQFLPMKWVKLDKVLDKIRLSLHDLIVSKKARIVYCDLPGLYAHESHLILLFQNLIENGLKYNKSAVPEISISAHREGDNCLIQIEDNGIGIPPEYQDKIFEMFYRLHAQEVYKGSGMGLAICRKILQFYEGSIEILPEAEKGSVFQLNFPLDREKREIRAPLAKGN